MLSGCKKINCFQHALELSQDKENEKNTHLHFVNMPINLKHINENKHFVLVNVFKYNSFAKCYIMCNLF